MAAHQAKKPAAARKESEGRQAEGLRIRLLRREEKTCRAKQSLWPKPGLGQGEASGQDQASGQEGQACNQDQRSSLRPSLRPNRLHRSKVKPQVGKVQTPDKGKAAAKITG